MAVRYALSSLHLPTIRLTGDNLLSLVEGSGPIAGQVGPDDMETVEIAEPTGDTSAVVIDYELVDGETSTPIDVGICLTFCQVNLVFFSFIAILNCACFRLMTCWFLIRFPKNWHVPLLHCI